MQVYKKDKLVQTVYIIPFYTSLSYLYSVIKSLQ